MIQLASAVCLLTLVGLCLCGIFSPLYRDNWGQFAGLCLLTVWAAARLGRVLDGDEVSSQQLLAYVGMAVYACGTAWKVWHFRGHSSFMERAPPQS